LIGFATAFGSAWALRSPVDPGVDHPPSLFLLLASWTCIVISAGGTFALNQVLERDADATMSRTDQRPLPLQQWSPGAVWILGLSLFLLPLIPLAAMGPFSAVLLTFLCGVSYVWGYTPLKYLTSFSTWVGALPGALLPLMGWSLVRQDWHPSIFLFALILFLWQAPHALIISLRYEEDYRSALMKQLPLVAGKATTMRQIALNLLALLALFLFPLGWVQLSVFYAILTITLHVGLLWLLVTYWFRPTPSHLSLNFLGNLLHLPVQMTLLFLFLLL
jgi:protoheme IX farnesyltransferase